MKALKLKLGTHKDSGLLCIYRRVYQNQGQGPISRVTSLARFYKIIKNIVALFSRTVRVTKLNPGTHMESGLMYHVYRNQGQGPVTHGVKSIDMFYVAILPCYHVLR